MEKTKKNRKFSTIIEALSTEPIPEPEFGPSIVEPCHNLSIEEILSDYTRGIVHTTRTAMYDDGDDIPDELDEFDDLIDLQPQVASVREVGKPSDTTDEERSDKEEVKKDPGPKLDAGEGGSEGDA